MYRSTLAVYSVNLILLGCGGLTFSGGLGGRGGESLVAIEHLPCYLVGQVVNQSEHHRVGGGYHQLRSTRGQAQQNTRSEYKEQSSNIQTHVQVKHFYLSDADLISLARRISPSRLGFLRTKPGYFFIR